jgi:branched-chain amino acid aminotransferase
MKVIQNGALVELAESLCNEKGWMAGEGVFETIRTVENAPWALSRHMRRAVSSARQLGFSIADEEEIRRAVSLLCETEGTPYGMLRLSFGIDGNWAAVHLPYVLNNQPATVMTFKKQIAFSGQPLKSYPYSHRLDILNSAKESGFDEAVIINDRNKVCEGSVTNLLVNLDGKWITPPISDGVLPGIMRALVIEYCGVSVKSIDVADLVRVQSAFLLSSLRIAQTVAAIDGRLLEPSPKFAAEIEAMALKTSVG